MPRQRDSQHHDHVHSPRSHGHGHGHEHTHHLHPQGEHDHWAEDDYLGRPGVFEVAEITYESILNSLVSAGIKDDIYKTWDVLEIGCGPGTVTKHLLSTFSTIHSIDVSPSMLLNLSKYLPSDLHPTLSYSLHNLSPNSPQQFKGKLPLRSPTVENPQRELSPPREKFDLAVSSYVLHHVDDLHSFMLGAIGLVKEGGWLVFAEMGLIPDGNGDGQLNPTKHDSFNAPEHHRPSFTIDSLTRLFESYGLTDVYAEQRGELPIFGTEEGKMRIPGLIVRGRKGKE
ncbi:hypothetical protein L486_06187 [Kwoniella mangroviensis CBS 10435]|uniref:Methyltransferase type 11 domain-containing protein n=1 Tax=Kwoniella mangroviensis CBS 10435 TaxID=1331196 RepID=A0A1B9IKT5_9TREE|nr:hypothetical protein L486_06187 [Kwoniella mangroviensis CBS 10435]